MHNNATEKYSLVPVFLRLYKKFTAAAFISLLRRLSQENIVDQADFTCTIYLSFTCTISKFLPYFPHLLVNVTAGVFIKILKFFVYKYSDILELEFYGDWI